MSKNACFQAALTTALVTPTTVFNFDIKKVMLRTDVKSFGTKVGTLKADPWLIGAGFGRRF